MAYIRYVNLCSSPLMEPLVASARQRHRRTCCDISEQVRSDGYALGSIPRYGWSSIYCNRYLNIILPTGESYLDF